MQSQEAMEQCRALGLGVVLHDLSGGFLFFSMPQHPPAKITTTLCWPFIINQNKAWEKASYQSEGDRYMLNLCSSRGPVRPADFPMKSGFYYGIF